MNQQSRDQELTELQKMENQSRITNRVAIALLAIGIVCLLGLPWLLTQNVGWIAFNDKTGWIGDTIGGITGPVSGFLGAALVYLALREQIKANGLIIHQFEYQKRDERNNKRLQYVTDQIKIIREDIKEFKFIDYRIGPDKNGLITALQDEYLGIIGIEAALKSFSKVGDHNENLEENVPRELGEIKFFLESIYYLVRLVTKSEKGEDEMDGEDKENLLRVVSETYKRYLYPSLAKYENFRLANRIPCEICNRPHPGLPEYIYATYDKINKAIGLQ